MTRQILSVLRQSVVVTGLVLAASSSVFAEDPAGAVLYGERVRPEHIGEQFVETLEDALERDRNAPPVKSAKLDRKQRFGEWRVPTPRGTGKAKSGRHYIVNSWGDTRMGIGFPELVHVDGVYVLGQESESVWTSGIQVIGYADGVEVSRTEVYRQIGETPNWFEIDLCDVDRIEVVAEPRIRGAGWYGLDDLTYSPVGDADRSATVIDFDELAYGQKLSGSRYGGLSWEFGTGFDHVEAMPGPRIEPGMSDKPQPGDVGDGGGIASGGEGTLPDLLDSFQTLTESNSFPPDTIGAIGPFQFVETVNSVYAVYSRITGSQLTSMNLGSFLPGTSGDPRVLFDVHSQRWIVIATDFDETIHIAVSSTESATGSWFKSSFDAAEGSDANRWVDFPTLGVDANGIYIAANMFGAGASGTIFVLDKAPLVAASQSLGAVTAFRSLPTDNAIQPVHAYTPSPGGYIVSTSGSGSIRLRRVDGPMTSPSLVSAGTFSVAGYSNPPDAEAFGSSTNVDTGDRRLVNAMYLNGSIWAAHTINSGGRAACRWYELDPVSVTQVQSGTVSSSGRHYYYPSIAANSFGHVLMGFSGSNSGTYINAYYTGRTSSDPPGEMATPEIYQFGNGPQTHIDNIGRNRWGDYSQTTLDPTNLTGLWTVQTYAHNTNTWGTFTAYSDGGDCNGSGLLDECDTTCGTVGSACDIPGCGQSADCNDNQIPDECETAVGSCCFPDGSCCDFTNSNSCGQFFGTYNGDGSSCDSLPVCDVAEARITCVADTSLAYPGGKVEVEMYITSVADLSTYQVSIEAETLTGIGSLSLDCSGCTGAANEPACATRVDESRGDYVFLDESGFAAVSCATDALGSVLLFGSVAVGETAAYAGEFTLQVSEDAEIGDQLEIRIGDSFNQSFLVQSTGDFTPYLTEGPCAVTVVEPPDCGTPLVEGEGGKTILVTPTFDVPQAIRVTGDPGDPAVSCVDLYVQEDETLGPTPVFQTLAQWGTVAVHGDEIIPNANYLVQADCGALSIPAAVSTWPWGDVEFPPNGVVNFADIQLVVQAFQLNFENVTLERADLEPCTPNRIANFGDIQVSVQAFQGQTYAETGCPIPCP